MTSTFKTNVRNNNLWSEQPSKITSLVWITLKNLKKSHLRSYANFEYLKTKIFSKTTLDRLLSIAKWIHRIYTGWGMRMLYVHFLYLWISLRKRRWISSVLFWASDRAKKGEKLCHWKMERSSSLPFPSSTFSQAHSKLMLLTWTGRKHGSERRGT